MKTEPIDESLSPSLRIVEELAEEKGISPLEVPPLYDVIDPYAVDCILNSMSGWGEITFHHDGYDVTIDSDDQITISSRDNEV